MLFFGWGRKVKPLGVGPILECPNCGNAKRWITAQTYRYVSIMFIPIVRWDSQYMMVCPVCERGVPLKSPDEATEMLRDQVESLLEGGGTNVEQFKARASDLAFLEHATSLNWPLVLNMQLMGHELLEADEIGVDKDEQPYWSENIVAAIRREIGEPTLIRALILETADAKTGAAFEAAINRFIESSGYSAARKRLFPELYGPNPGMARIGLEPHPSLVSERFESATEAVASARNKPGDESSYRSAQLAVLSYLAVCSPAERDRVNQLMERLLSAEVSVASTVGLDQLDRILQEVSAAGHSAGSAARAIARFDV